MDYFNNFKINIISGIVLTINIVAILLVITSNKLHDEETSLNLSTSVGGIGMSIGESDFLNDEKDTFIFKEKSKIKTELQRYTSDIYKLNTILNNNIVGEVIDVPFINQTIKYPTGCESVSAASVLQYYGIGISVDDFIDNFLSKTELEVIGYNRQGDKILSGKHPNDSFIGNPKSSYGLGCYERTITNAVTKVLEEFNLQDYFTVEHHRDLTIQDVESYLDNNIPVIVWATQNMVPSEKGLNWYIEDTDILFQYMKNEHCMVAIGYDDEYIYFNDTLIGRIAYPKMLLEDRYIQMGTRTVTITYNY